MALFTSAVYSMFFLLTLHMQLTLGWSPLRTGVAYLAFTVGVLAGIGAASQLLPKLGVRQALVAGMTLAAGAVLAALLIGHFKPTSLPTPMPIGATEDEDESWAPVA
jgi:predicted MFS family arabinose efflux permease